METIRSSGEIAPSGSFFKDASALFIVSGAVLAIMVGAFLMEHLSGVPIRNTGMIFVFASITLFLRVFALVCALYEGSLESVSGKLREFVWSLGTLYAGTAFAFAYALHQRSGLYLPFLAATILIVAAIVVTFFVEVFSGGKPEETGEDLL